MKAPLTSVFFFLLAFAVPGFSQYTPGNIGFSDGEKASFNVVYSWGPVWVEAATVTMEARKEKRAGKELWHLKISGRTLPAYEWFFKVRDYYESWVEPTGFSPVEFRRSIYENGRTVINTQHFLPGGAGVVSHTKRNNDPVKTDTLHPGVCAFDMLTSVYYFRTVDIASLPLKEKVPVKVLIDDSVFNIYVRYLGKEEVILPDGRQFNCLKCAARMVSGTIFKGGEDVLVWVTDDPRKFPVYIEAKILVGSVKAFLR